MWQAQVITLFPEMFPGALNYSIAGKALRNLQWVLKTINLRDYAGAHGSVDDTTYGGGSGMILRPDVVDRALLDKSDDKTHWLYLSPRGQTVTQANLLSWAHQPGINFLCGRYEGVDQRVINHWQAKGQLSEVSLGDFVLSGGELAALTILDGCVRLLPQVLSDEAAFAESFSVDLLEHSHYTKPRVFYDQSVPDVLLNGNHKAISEWRHQESLLITEQRRPDLLKNYLLRS